MDANTFRNLAMAEIQALFRLAHHLARNNADAEDLVQETYLRAFKAQATFRHNEIGLKPWLLRILHNVFLTRAKRSRLEPKAGDIAEDLAQTSEIDGDLTGQSLENLDWEQVDDRLKKAIQELPSTYKTPFLLSAVEGMKYREIAQVLEMPIGTVMSRLFRARTMLLTQLKPLADELGLDSTSSSPNE